MKTAAVEDFKIGAELIDKEDERATFTIIRKEQDGVWIARGKGGDKCLFECEAAGYFVK